MAYVRYKDLCWRCGMYTDVLYDIHIYYIIDIYNVYMLYSARCEKSYYFFRGDGGGGNGPLKGGNVLTSGD